MNRTRTEIGPTVSALALLFAALICSGSVYGQDEGPLAQKFDEFEDMKTDDIQARLDLFAQQLQKSQDLQGFIVGYQPENWLQGSFLRYLNGLQDYLVNARGVEPHRLKVIEGGTQDKMKTELWLSQPGASVSPSANRVKPALDTLTQFDQLISGLGCESEYTLVLETPEDALKYFAGALRDNPTYKGFVLVRPSESESWRNAHKRGTFSTRVLRKEYGLGPDRIVLQIEGRHHCSELNLWLASSTLMIPNGPGVGSFFQSQLMAEAEKSDYTVRRIELLGNTYTRDNVIRRRLLQNEGDIFRRKLLEQSLRNVSTLRNIRQVGIQDVEVHLNRKDKSIDFLINLKERPGSRKRQFH